VPDYVAPITIRPFNRADQAATRRLILAGLGDHFGAIDETLNPDLDDIATSYLDSGGAFVVAVAGDGRIIGTGGLIEERPGVGRLVRMSVDRSRRGEGIGRSLVTHLCYLAKERGYSLVVCETNDDWEDAIALYRTCGFRDFGKWNEDIHFERPVG
jgi:GNAT superfamily N-acetyltransferase